MNKNKAENKNLKRAVVYLPAEDYKILRSWLLLRKKTVSSWFRDKVNSALKDIK